MATWTTFPNCYSFSLSLDSWREFFGFHPLHFWQMYNGEVAPLDSSCDSIVYEKPWQGVDQLGRMQIREAIQRVTHNMARYLGYFPAPTQITEVIDVSTMDIRGGCLLLKLKWPRVKNIGRWIFSTNTELAWGSDILPYDFDQDEFDESGLIDEGLIDPDKLSAGDYFLLNDSWHQAFSNSSTPFSDIWPWLVEPLAPAYDSGVLQGLTFPAVQALTRGRRFGLRVEPEELGIDVTDPEAEEPDYDNLGPMILGIRTLWQDEAVELIYSSPCTCNSGITESQFLPTTAWDLTDGYTGYLQVRLPCTCRVPDKIRIQYIAGDDLCNWVDSIARYSAADMERNICGCETSNRELQRWQEDLGEVPEDTSYNISEENVNNPFGTRLGAIYAWQRVNNSQSLRSVAFQK